MDSERLERIRRDLCHPTPNGQHWQIEHARALLAEVERLREFARGVRDTASRPHLVAAARDLVGDD